MLFWISLKKLEGSEPNGFKTLEKIFEVKAGPCANTSRDSLRISAKNRYFGCLFVSENLLVQLRINKHCCASLNTFWNNTIMELI